MQRKNIQVLIAEDNPGDLYLIRRALDRYVGDCRLLLAADGPQALEILDRADADAQAPCPDFILLDLNLPRLSGARVLERLRRSRRCRQTPVVVVTSSESAQDKDEVLRLGADRYFRKPTDLKSFMQIGAIVRDLLGRPPRGISSGCQTLRTDP